MAGKRGKGGGCSGEGGGLTVGTRLQNSTGFAFSIQTVLWYACKTVWSTINKEIAGFLFFIAWCTSAPETCQYCTHLTYSVAATI